MNLIAILSGPEPQRSRLEEKLLQQLIDLPINALVVQGKTEGADQKKQVKNIEIRSFLKAQELGQAIAASNFVVCRSGYSSIMDLVRLGKKALLIPTPGQTEQEYLAQNLYQKGVFLQQKQGDLNIREALNKMNRYTGTGQPIALTNHLQRIAQQLLSEL